MKSVAESEAAKRPRLEAHISTTSSGTGSSAASQHDGDTLSGRSRIESTTSGGQWNANDGSGGASSQFANVPKLSLTPGGPKRLGSPNSTSPTVLPGYRESIYGTPQQAIPWRENPRDDRYNSLQQLSHIASGNDRRPSYTGSPSDKLNLTGSLQHAHRTGQGNPPPLLTHESTTSTNRSTASSGSTVSSAYFAPRTPMEPPLERALPIPALYSQKSNGSFEHQLPPIRPPSLSPRSTLRGSQQSPNGISTFQSFLFSCRLLCF